MRALNPEEEIGGAPTFKIFLDGSITMVVEHTFRCQGSQMNGTDSELKVTQALRHMSKKIFVLYAKEKFFRTFFDRQFLAFCLVWILRGSVVNS